jgi:hypothetical protein
MEKFTNTINLPTLAIHFHRAQVDPVSTVIVQSLFQEQDDHSKGEELTLITTIEVIQDVIEQFWTCISEGEPIFDDKLHLTLEFCDKNPRRLLYLEGHILKSWEQMQGFKTVSLIGDIDQGLARHLDDRMIMGLIQATSINTWGSING